MVAVGDQGLRADELAGHGLLDPRVDDRPEPVRAAVEGDHVRLRRLGRDGGEQVPQPVGAAVREQDRLEVGARGAHQHRAVVDRPGHHVFVRQDHALVLGA